MASEDERNEVTSSGRRSIVGSVYLVKFRMLFASLTLSHRVQKLSSCKILHTSTMRASPPTPPPENDFYGQDCIASQIGHSFPDFIEHWNRKNFYRVGYGLSGITMASAYLGGWPVGMVLGSLTAAYWKVGLSDIRQSSHSIRRNFPVLGNMRYLLGKFGGGGR